MGKFGPNAPKGALGSYFIFMGGERPQLMKDHPDWKIGDIGKKLGEMWKEISEDKKAECQRKADQDKARYETEMEAYKKTDEYAEFLNAPKGEKGGKPGKLDIKKGPNWPKAALSGYMLYSGTVRPKIAAENPSFKIPDIGKAIGKLWGDLDEAGKNEWQEKSAADKPRFEKEMAEYKETDEYKDAVAAAEPKPGKAGKAGASDKAVKDTKKAEKELAAKYEIPKRPQAGFFIFTNANRDKVKAEHPDWGIGEMGKHFGAEWGKMDEAAKAPYEEKAVAAKAAYAIKKEEWDASDECKEYTEALAKIKSDAKSAAKASAKPAKKGAAKAGTKRKSSTPTKGGKILAESDDEESSSEDEAPTKKRRVIDSDDE